ncbi:hypothetical protein B484DRAFT_416605 [Ochromonadaceae sp. CCMP2298]|nr:hypothetical protein B484DRAFT_416605 [Ochromonadaceae sp. CCMP2298]
MHLYTHSYYEWDKDDPAKQPRVVCLTHGEHFLIQHPSSYFGAIEQACAASQEHTVGFFEQRINPFVRERDEEQGRKLISDDVQAVGAALDRHPQLINKRIDELLYDGTFSYPPLVWAVFSYASPAVTALLLSRGGDKKLYGNRDGNTYETALQLLERLRESSTDPEHGEGQIEFSIEHWGRGYTQEWYDATKALLDPEGLMGGEKRASAEAG